MNDTKPDDVVETPEVAVPVAEKKKRGPGRPKKVEGSKINRPRRDMFADAFGDKRAAVAVKGLPKNGPERKAVVAAVKALAGSTKKREKLAKQIKKLSARLEKVNKLIGERNAEMFKLDNAVSTVDAYKPRIAHLIKTLYGEDIQVRSLAEPAVEGKV